MRNEVILGWGAEPIGVQHPIIPAADADHFDRDNQAIARLSVRGLLTMSQRDAAYKKLTRSVEAAIRREMQAIAAAHRAL